MALRMWHLKLAISTTFQSVFDDVIQAHFPIALGRVVIRLVSCPSTCFEAMALMSR